MKRLFLKSDSLVHLEQISGGFLYPFRAERDMLSSRC